MSKSNTFKLVEAIASDNAAQANEFLSKSLRAKAQQILDIRKVALTAEFFPKK